MPQRLRLTEGDREWVAEVTGDEVRLIEAVEATGTAAPTDQTVIVRRDADDHFQVDDGSGARDALGVLASDVAWVSIDNHVFEIQLATAGRAARSSARDHDALAPPMSATVVRIAVKPGDQVRQGDLLVALEAMKMELPIRAPRDGVVKAVHCHEGELVQPGKALVDIES